METTKDIMKELFLLALFEWRMKFSWELEKLFLQKDVLSNRSKETCGSRSSIFIVTIVLLLWMNFKTIVIKSIKNKPSLESELNTKIPKMNAQSRQLCE